MSAPRFTLPELQTILPDLVAFAVGLGCAWVLQWNTTDLVWSLWLSSLVLGYLSILSAIGKGIYIGSAIVSADGFPAQHRVKTVLIGSLLALFLLTFFSLHFCGFHAIHAGFLKSFFPLPGLPKHSFSLNPFRLWNDALTYVMPKYGFFLIPVAIAERRAVLGSIGALIRARPLLQPEQAVGQLLGASGMSGHDLISRPYLNVVRMHLLIFFFAICHALKIDSFPVYAVVYSVYFFPWSAVRETARDPQGIARA